jgi:hypothetical protein
MAILETIAAANAAYSVIKTCIQNGKEGADLMSSVGKFLTAEEELKDAVQKKKNSPLTAITGGAEGDWEEFQQLEKIKEQRKELESYIRLYGRPGQWDMKKREEQLELMQIVTVITLAATGVILGIYYLGVYLERW